MDKVNVTVKTENGELVIRQGEAQKPLPLNPRKNIKITSTDINGPAKFWESKKSLYVGVNSHVLYDKTCGKILLVLMEDTVEKRDEVSGSLSDNPELMEMKINSDSLVNHKEMLKRLRWARGMFPERAEYDKIVSALMNFKAKIDIEIEKADDKQGNSIDSVVTKVNQQIPLGFNLKTNLFIGQPEVQFDVQIIVATSGRELVFGLESMTLHEMQGKTRSSIIDEVLAKIDGIVHIEAKL